MASSADFRRIALSLAGTTEAPHFDRAALKVVRIYTTLASDGTSANLKLTPDEQEFKCLLHPQAFSALPNAWGRQGWTRVEFAAVDEAELTAALQLAWEHGRAKRGR